MRKDAMVYAQKFDSCQRHSNILHQRHEPIHPIASPWPFMKWGMDIIGKLPEAPGGKVFMLAMTAEMNYDSGSQFIGKRTTEFYATWRINVITSTPMHSQAKGQAESSNKIIVNNMMKKLGAKKGKWAEELSFVLWADRTKSKNTTGKFLSP
ncbi:uncharacterized protein LOC143575902 [Bidens hawaiensis]|uniref:uncharacterized protein LOC143575902 n=1 Tax=Bidens hawaiensis TaxID=980011 RepID=UPI00404B6A59